VLGPGAALYGPNSSNGVLAITTKSPFESKGTTFVLESGFRSTSRDADGESLGDGSEPYYRVGFRHASAGSKVGFKLSGEYLQGQEWRMRDPAEPASLPNRACTPSSAAATSTSRSGTSTPGSTGGRPPAPS